MKQQIQELLNSKMSQVQDAYPSIFTKDDVKVLLSDIIDVVDNIEEDDVQLQISDEFVNKLKKNVKDAIIDYDFDYNAEVDLYDKRIEVSFDTSEICDLAVSAINEVVEEYTEKAVSGE